MELNEYLTNQSGRNERHAQMLETGIGADVYFLVGKADEEKELIFAHKYMLSIGSDVFEGQFFRFNETINSQEGTKGKPIEITDVSPDAFRAMLKYIYTQDLSAVNKKDVLDVYYAGEKYMIPALVDKCRQWLLKDQNLDADNVLSVLKFAQRHEDKALIEHCWKCVEKNARMVIDSEDFLLLEEADLREIFSRNRSRINELKAHLLDTGKCADLYYLVGPKNGKKELISGHKFILLAASKLLGKQFDGIMFFLFDIPWRKDSLNKNKQPQLGTKERPILVSDVRPEIFHVMLRYIYTQDFSGVNKQNIMDVYFAGNKYRIEVLINECRRFLMNGQNLGRDNLLLVLRDAKRHWDFNLINHCWTFVEKNAKAVLDSEEFFKFEQAEMCELLGRDALEADELFLFQSLHHWAIRKCEAEGLEPTAQNKRNVVGEAIYQIRFPLIPQKQFTGVIVPSGLLTKDDIIAVYVQCSDKNFVNCSDCTNRKILCFLSLKSPNERCCDCTDSKLQYPSRFISQRRNSKK